MNTPATLLALTLACTACVSTDDSNTTPAPDAAAADGMSGPSPEALMAMVMEAGKPGKIHEELAALTGQWDVTYEAWQEPEGEPLKGTGTSTYRSILAGRYLVEEFHSQFAGQPFEGMLLMGYDNVREQYQSIWVDSLSTGFVTQTGTVAADGTKRLNGMTYDPMTPQGRPMRSELQELSPDHFTMQMFDTLPDGSEWMTMSFQYRRTGS